ncbi:PIG-P-domain-containing protein [Apiosordaria backusii]|uniref:PIG-P-domain-containing protein n=1 Tax=Apiosordaria backusii TaxID=314023 RepID=A0AA40EZB5_9PEZI|nr:PIG-P-domain-containing protein [Apiosordaria backusii]
MSITSEEEVEEDATPLSDSPSHNDSSDSNHGGSGNSGDGGLHHNHDLEHNNNGGSTSPSAASNPGSDYEDEYDEDEDFEEDDDGDDDGGDGNTFPPVPPFTQHTFAPPFYGRPPTPLPPSPSLTSLLRPSRPTTPDASDDEHAEPLPRARPKVPTYEYYGFVLYLFSSLLFLFYLLWSYLPSPFLHALGIYYYPNRWWSLAVPSFIVMLLVYIYVALAAYNVEILTLPMGSIETVVDEAAQVAVVDSRGRIKAVGRRPGGNNNNNGQGHRRKGSGRSRDDEHAGGGYNGQGLDWREVWNEGTDAVMDVPLAGVCEVLYGYGNGEEEGGEDVITRV